MIGESRAMIGVFRIPSVLCLSFMLVSGSGQLTCAAAGPASGYAASSCHTSILYFCSSCRLQPDYNVLGNVCLSSPSTLWIRVRIGMVKSMRGRLYLPIRAAGVNLINRQLARDLGRCAGAFDGCDASHRSGCDE